MRSAPRRISSAFVLSLVVALVLSLGACRRAPEPGADETIPQNDRIAEPATTPSATPSPVASPSENPATQNQVAVAPPPASPPPEIAQQVAAEPPPPPAPPSPELLDVAHANERAPARYTVELDTTKGVVTIDVTRAWAPLGADRFYNLVRRGYFNDVAFFRVVEGFMAQVGIHGNPIVNTAWREARIQDDPVTQSNTRGMVTFATSGPNSRTTQFFINFTNNANLDGMGFAPFGKVRDMAPVDALYNGYGEGAPRGAGPMQGRIQAEGNTYLRASFPQLDYIRSARIVGAGAARGRGGPGR